MKKLYLAALAAFLLTSTSFSQTVIRVDRDAPGIVEDGLSWATAYVDLQPALLANGGTTTPIQFWVAEGIYKPGGSEFSSFQLGGLFSVYGAFLGFDSAGLGVGEETSIATREGRVSRTILSGDRNNLGRLDPSGNQHVVRIENDFDNTNPGLTTIDGVRIQHGYADQFGQPNSFPDVGGGILIGGIESVQRVSLRNLQIVENAAVTSGGGIFATDLLDFEMVNCTVERNGVIPQTGPSNNLPGYGGGVCLERVVGGSLEDSVAIYNSQFLSNSSPFGSGLSILGFGVPFGFFPTTPPANGFVGNCLFANNTSTDEMGAFLFGNINMKAGEMDFHHNTLVNNSGGGITLDDPTPSSSSPFRVSSCISTGNTTSLGAFTDLSGSAVPNATVGFSLIGSSGMPVAGLGNITGNPQYISPASGNFRLRLNSPAIDAASDTPLAPFGAVGTVGDIVDLDGDGITTAEALPFDLDVGQPREQDVSTVPNTGQDAAGTLPAISDMGCYERQAN